MIKKLILLIALVTMLVPLIPAPISAGQIQRAGVRAPQHDTWRWMEIRQWWARHWKFTREIPGGPLVRSKTDSVLVRTDTTYSSGRSGTGGQ